MADLKETVYNDLVLRIVTHQLPSGQRLNEKDIMEYYGVGKTPLREVMLLLQANGLIRRFPRSGTIVAPIDFTELRESAEIRVALEEVLCELVIARITAAELELLEEQTRALTEAAVHGITTNFITTECGLHAILYNASRNSKMAKLLNEQQHVFARMWHSFERSQGDLQAQVNDWEKICSAIRAKDKKQLKQVYKNHFKSFYESLKGFF